MKNKTAIAAIAALAIIGIVSGTYAYFTSQATVTNTFTATSYRTQVTRSLNDQGWLPGTSITGFDLKVTNTGNTPIVVRAKIDTTANTGERFQRVSGDERSASSLQTSSVTKAFDTTNWVQGSGTGDDAGYYYYTSVVAPSTSTTNFITSLTLNSSVGNASECTYDAAASGHESEDPGNGNVTCISGVNGYDNTEYVLPVVFETIQWDQAKTGASWASIEPAALKTAADRYGTSNS